MDWAAFLPSHYPRFAVPAYLDKPPTGKLQYDLVPVLTMAACLPTLSVFLARRDLFNFVLYGAGFVIAVVYHMLQLEAHNGLASVQWLGVDGTGWRTLDIVSANILLARTWGHALCVDHPLLSALPNMLLPVAILTLLAQYTGVTLGFCARVTAATMLVTLVIHLALSGRPLLRHLKRQYADRQMWSALLTMALGIYVFALPTYYPAMYWLYHSLWHVLMGWGYYYLYKGLLGHYWQEWHEERVGVAKAGPMGVSVAAGLGSKSQENLTTLAALAGKAGALGPKSTRGSTMARSNSSASTDTLDLEGEKDSQERKQKEQAKSPLGVVRGLRSRSRQAQQAAAEAVPAAVQRVRSFAVPDSSMSERSGEDSEGGERGPAARQRSARRRAARL